MNTAVRLLLTAALGAAAACSALPHEANIDLATKPRTVFRTIPFEVGETYTLGATAVPLEAKRPVTITAVDVLHFKAIEVLGTAAFEPRGESVGLAPGWPPPGHLDMHEYRDPLEAGVQWHGAVQPVIGVRTLAERSGLRGVRLSWIDADGVQGTKVFDIAVYTCSPGACVEGSAAQEVVLMELELMQ